jgi:hypothetical protein
MYDHQFSKKICNFRIGIFLYNVKNMADERICSLILGLITKINEPSKIDKIILNINT